MSHLSQRLTRPDRGERVARRELRDEVEQRRTIRRWFLAPDSAPQHQIGVILTGEHRKCRRATRNRMDRQHQFAQHATRNTHGHSGIRDAHLEFVHRRSAVSELLEEQRRPRAATSGINNEVRGQQRFTIITVPHHPGPGNAVPIEVHRQAHDIMVLEELHVGNGEHLSAHTELQ